MASLECPNCHQKTIPRWRKMFLGPATTTTCSACGARISVPYTAMWAVVPFLIGLLAAQYFGVSITAGVLVVAGFLVMSWIHYSYASLIVKKP